MKKFFLWFFTASISVSFPNLILAQDSGNLDRAKTIDLQMNCVQSQLASNKGIGWSDVCDVPQAPQGTDTNGQPVANQDASSPISVSANQLAAGLFDPVSTRIITDPLYLPLKGQFFGSTLYTFTRPTDSTYDYKGRKIDSSKGDNNSFSQILEYGFTDAFSLRFLDSYDLNKGLTTSSHDTTSVSDSRGFSDPEIGVNYRVLDQVKYPVDFDLGANYLPDAFPLKSSGNGKEGTAGSGFQEVVLSAGVGREMKALSIQAVANAYYVGDKNYRSLGNDNEYQYNDNWEYSIAINTQTRLTDRFSVNLGTEYTLANNTRGTDTTSGLSWISVQPNVLSLKTSINYQFIPDRLVGSLMYTYEDLAHSKTLYANVASDSEVRHLTENVFGAELSYLFN